MTDQPTGKKTHRYRNVFECCLKSMTAKQKFSHRYYHHDNNDCPSLPKPIKAILVTMAMKILCCMFTAISAVCMFIIISVTKHEPASETLDNSSNNNSQ